MLDLWWKLVLTKIKQRMRVQHHCSLQLINGHLDVVRHLVEVGADKDQAENSGETPLFIAAQNGQLEVVRHLVAVGADKDQALNSGATPLYIAAEERPS